MRKKTFFKLFPLILAAILLSGCSLDFNTGAGSGGLTDGGVFKSTNKGAGWAQKTSIAAVGVKKGFAGIDIVSLALDPSDNKAIYAGSIENGLFYSYDGAESWHVAASLGKITVNDIAVDHSDKCTIYAASANKILKSDDCSRTWSQVYFDNDLKILVNSIAIDPADSRNVFIGTSNGDVIKSSDKGANWRVSARFESQVYKIAVSPVNSKIIFAGTAAKGVFRSLDGGEKWESLKDKLASFDGNSRLRDIAMAKSGKAAVFLATNYGMIKSTDNGNTWSKIELLTAEEEAVIYSMVVNSGNADEIYYVTGTTFYRSLDGGKKWSSKKLPTNRAGFRLLLDPKDPAIVYLAARQIKK